MNIPTPAHGALALSPRAGELVEARRTFNDPQASDEGKVSAAKVMAELGTAFDQGRARRWLRERVIDRAG